MKKILCMSLCLILALGLLTACGSSTGENETGSEAVTQPSTEETKVPETTTAAQEPSTSNERVFVFEDYLYYSRYPISEETKVMLVEKLTNLELVEGQEFDINSLTFKEDEFVARSFVKSMLRSAMYSSMSYDSSILVCRCKKLELYKVDVKDDCMEFYFKQILVKG